jgi:energy-converting hydrogenase B subunit D
MTSFWVLDYLCLAGVVTGAVLVVRLRNLAGAAMALSLVGVCLALLFVVLGAPDDAHAEVVVGAIALPTLYLLAIGKTRADVEDTGELGEPADPPEARR